MAGPNEPVVLLTPAELADALGVRVETARNWRYRGEGPPFVKVGSRVRYRLADLNAWIASRVRTSTSDPGPPGDAA